ncbi:hypothetical protein ACFP63_08795 [Oerskovia jenensis]|uniref:Uncharacterized protein n=1 Tax=Oerskovia jenensis TaxID=162169 RepID=A0ABS2LIA4_9CELL|nr:hypothetical protein [Oerskovia jenensis]MBM7480150.1 hypothetical protein [Oerskovia jenensis]
MMTRINREQAHALAALVAALRGDWDTPGVLKALSDARDRGDVFRLAHAALYAAETPTNRTPAVIALAGEHWARGRDVGTGDTRFDRCDVPGDAHRSYPKGRCGACRADELAADDHTPTPAPAPIPAAYTSGANLVRQAARLPIKEHP